MSSVLLDTHVFLWFVFDDPRLSRRAEDVLNDPDCSKVLSMASLWEIAVKVNIKKLSLGMPFSDFLSTGVTASDLSVLDICLPHLAEYTHLPTHHRDPFDRLLIAQARVEELSVITADSRFQQYDLTTVW